MERELQAKHDSRNSFYGKAHTIQDADGITLRSYWTNVANIKDGKATVFGRYSNTTLRHIKEFLKQNGYKAESKSQIEEDYI